MKNLLTLFLSISLFATSDIAVITLAAGERYKDTVQLGIDNKRRYCEKYGYDFICCEERLDPSRHFSWSKIQLVLKTMESKKYKWIFWTDADSLIMNMTIPLEKFIDEKAHFILASDPHSTYNMGQFFIKNCDWSRDFLKAIYAHTECIDHKWWEQQALVNELNEKPEQLAFIKVVPLRLFNSTPKRFLRAKEVSTFETGDFIIHFSGVHHLDKLKSCFITYSKQVMTEGG